MFNWVNDVAAETVLLDMDIATEEKTIRVADIDKKLSSQNRARAISLDESRVEGIRSAADKGVPIPKLVVRDIGGRYVIAGGNHRFAAINGDTEVPVHVMQCSDAEFEIACRVLNTVVGVGMTKEERVASAVDAINRLGMTQAVVARLYGLKESTVNNAMTNVAVERRIKTIAPKIASKVKKTHVLKLAELARNDNILRAACNLISETNCSAEDIALLTKEAKSKATESAQVAVFEEALAIRKSDLKKTVPRRKRQEFVTTLTRIKNLIGVASWKALEVEPSEIESMKSQVREAMNTLKTLLRVDG